MGTTRPVGTEGLVPDVRSEEANGRGIGVTDEQCGAVRLLLAAIKATTEEQRTAAIVDRMDGQADPGYDAALDMAVEANRKARRARKAVTADCLAIVEGMLGDCW